MSEAEIRPPYRADYACAIWHPSEARLLAIENALPELVSPESVYTSPGRVQAQVRDALGLDVCVLRRIGFERDVAQNRARMAFELELASGANSIPTDARWVGLAEWSSLKPAHRELAKTVLEEGACVPALRPAWARRGWWMDALAWLDAQLESLGEIRTRIEQQKTWQISSLSRIETSLGRLYFKAVPPFFAREPGLTRWLMAHFPRHSPEVLAVDTNRGWMLMRDFGGQELGPDTPLEVVRTALNDYARLQIATIPHAGTLRNLGCLDRSLEVLKIHIHELLWDESVLMRDCEDGLSSQQIAQLRNLEPEFVRRCDALSRLGLPAVLEHGDLWRNNVQIVDGRAVFHDWTDGAIAFGLQSVPLIELQPTDWGEGARDALIEAYLEPWTAFLPMPSLREAFELVQPLIQLYRAATHPQYILPGVEDTKEWLGGVIWMLQSALKVMGD